MNFTDLLLRAQNDEPGAIQQVLEMYRPLLLKESISAGTFDEDLYQELCMTLLHCIRKFTV